MKKLDIMKMKDGEDSWEMVNGKPTKVKKQPVGEEKKVDKNLKVEGPTVRESIKVVKDKSEEVKKEHADRDYKKRSK